MKTYKKKEWLIIMGNKKYLQNLKSHLAKEHPKTKGQSFIIRRKRK